MSFNLNDPAERKRAIEQLGGDGYSELIAGAPDQVDVGAVALRGLT